MAIQKTIENLDNLIIREVLQSASGSLSPQKRNKAIRALQSIPRNQTLGKSDVFPNVDTALESLLHGLDDLIAIEDQIQGSNMNRLSKRVGLPLMNQIDSMDRKATSSHVTRDKRGNLKLNLEPEDMPSRLHGTHEDRKASIKAWKSRQRGKKKQQKTRGGKRTKGTRKEANGIKNLINAMVYNSKGDESLVSNEAIQIIDQLLSKGDINGVLNFVDKKAGTSFISEEFANNIYEEISIDTLDKKYPNGVTGEYTPKVHKSTDFLIGGLFGDDFADGKQGLREWIDRPKDESGKRDYSGLNRVGREGFAIWLDGEFDRKAFKKTWGVSWDQYMDDIENNPDTLYTERSYDVEPQRYSIQEVAESVVEVMSDGGYFGSRNHVSPKTISKMLNGEGWDDHFLMPYDEEGEPFQVDQGFKNAAKRKKRRR